MEQENVSSAKNNSAAMKLSIFVVLAVIVIAAVFLVSRPGLDSKEKALVSASASPVATNLQKAMASYKDGDFSAVGQYTTPGGEENIGVEVKLTGGVITSVEVEQLAKLPVSKTMQKDFADNFKTMVVGKKIDEVNLTKVSGSSLTPKGFNAAIEKIKASAKS